MVRGESSLSFIVTLFGSKYEEKCERQLLLGLLERAREAVCTGLDLRGLDSSPGSDVTL